MFTFINPFVSISLLYIILNFVEWKLLRKNYYYFPPPLIIFFKWRELSKKINEIKKLIKNEDDLKRWCVIQVAYRSQRKYRRGINLVKILQRFHDQLFLFYSVLRKKPLLLVPVSRIISYNRIGAFSILDNLVDDKITWITYLFNYFHFFNARVYTFVVVQ